MASPRGLTASSGIWGGGPTSMPGGYGSTPGAGGISGLPVVTNSNLPSNTMGGIGGLSSAVPQPPTTSFPLYPQSGGPANSLISNNYATANTAPSLNANSTNEIQSQLLAAQNKAYQRRLTQLEDENEQRRSATMNLTQMGSQLLQGQMDVQEQVLQYQFMLEQCMETLDHQNSILNEQAEELALLRAKMRHFEYLMDALKLSKEGSNLLRASGDPTLINGNRTWCGNPLALPAPSTSPFYAGGPTRVTASSFQPFNPRYRSPNARAVAAGNLNRRQSATPTNTNKNPTTANERLSRRPGTFN